MISFRKATSEDFEEVYSINPDLYNGADTLSCAENFHFLLTRSFNLGCVAVLHGKPVGFALATITDGGETVITRFARVKPEMRGRRVYHNMILYLMQQLRPWEQGVKQHIYINGSSGPVPVPRRNATCTAKQVQLLCHHRQAKEIITTQAILPGFIHEIVDDKQKRELLSSQELAESLFGKDRIVIGLVPYKVMAENYDMIMENENPLVMAEMKNGQYLSVSISTVAQLHDLNSVCIRTTVFTTDPVKAADHCVMQVKRLAERNQSKQLRIRFLLHQNFSTELPDRKMVEEKIHTELGLTFWEPYPDPHLVTIELNDFMLDEPVEISTEKLS